MLGNALVQTCPPVEERDAEVLVFGAGVTGVTTARALYDNGLTKVLVLEAEDRIGGRIKNIEFGGVQVELGANWIHKVDVNMENRENDHPIWTIAHSTNICPKTFTSSLETEKTDFSNYEAYDENGNNDAEAFGMASKKVYDKVMPKGKLEEYSRMLQSNGNADITVREALIKKGWKPSNPTEYVAEWYNFDFSYAENPDKTSLFGVYPDKNNNYDFSSETNFFVTDPRGYSSVVDCIAEGLPKDSIRLGHTVNSISYNDDCVCASVTKSDGRERTMCGTYGVATFSVGVLKDFVNKSLFDPQLSAGKLNFIHSISMAYHLKIFVSFPKAFWNTNKQFIVRSDAQRGRYPLIQPLNLLPNNPIANIILMTVTEDEAVRISNQDKSTTTMEIMGVLRRIYGNDIPKPNEIMVPTWINDPLYRGMYSNTAIGLAVEDHQAFKKAEMKLYFSGEANIVGENGYVHSGYCSGMETSEAILKDTERPTDGSNLPSCSCTSSTTLVLSTVARALATVAVLVIAVALWCNKACTSKIFRMHKKLIYS